MSAHACVFRGSLAEMRGADWRDRPCVLIVDDDAMIRETLACFLEELGYDVLTAQDGLLALKVLQASTRPLVVLLDVMMPGMSGVDVLIRAAADDRLARRNAFILMTANLEALPPALVRRLKDVSVAILSKPFDLDTLLELIERAGQRRDIAATSSCSGGRP